MDARPDAANVIGDAILPGYAERQQCELTSTTTCRLGAAGGVFTAAFGVRIWGAARPRLHRNYRPGTNQATDRKPLCHGSLQAWSMTSNTSAATNRVGAPRGGPCLARSAAALADSSSS